MHAQYIALSLFASAAFAAPAGMKVARDDCSSACMDNYNTCRGQADANRAECASEYATCLGYYPFDDSGSLVTPTACASTVTSTSSVTSIPGGCNPAHPGSCPSSYFSTSTSVPSTTSILGGSSTTSIPGGCNPAHPGSCPSSYFSTSTSFPSTTSIPGGCNPAHPGSCPSSYFSTSTSVPSTTSILGGSNPTSIPGGCNPAHPGSCPSSYFSTITIVTATATDASSSTVTQIVAATPATGSFVIEGAEWTIKDLVRYCSADDSGCDYNFAISTNDERADEKCTIIRMPGSDATTESFYNVPCTSGSDNSISWGYSAQFGIESAFAVLTVTNNVENANAYFGIANVNSGVVTASSPAGSGNFGDIGPEPVYAF